jgi:hypothetical protein
MSKPIKLESEAHVLSSSRASSLADALVTPPPSTNKRKRASAPTPPSRSDRVPSGAIEDLDGEPVTTPGQMSSLGQTHEKITAYNRALSDEVVNLRDDAAKCAKQRAQYMNRIGELTEQVREGDSRLKELTEQLRERDSRLKGLADKVRKLKRGGKAPGLRVEEGCDRIRDLLRDIAYNIDELSGPSKPTPDNNEQSDDDSDQVPPTARFKTTAKKIPIKKTPVKSISHYHAPDPYAYDDDSDQVPPTASFKTAAKKIPIKKTPVKSISHYHAPDPYAYDDEDDEEYTAY